MKLVMTLLVRDESDILDSWLEYHRAAGVDLFIATDHRSEDGTSEILARHARAGYVHVLREDGDGIRQDEWVTSMARLAATEFGADWVINSDADEFWWPRAGSLRDVLATVPERYGVVRGAWRHFLPRPEELGPLFERMTVRLCVPAHPGEKRTIFHAHQKVAHRARRDVQVETGNHNAEGTGLEPLRGWYPLEVLHFSLRSLSQFERKTTQAYDAWGKNRVHGRSAYHVLAYEAWEAGRLDEYFGAYVVDDDELRAGVAEGRLAVDTRLRDALRELGSRTSISFRHPTPVDDAAYAAEIASLVDTDGIVRAERRVGALEKRLAGLRTLPRR